jgi:hypothetical protein
MTKARSNAHPSNAIPKLIKFDEGRRRPWQPTALQGGPVFASHRILGRGLTAKLALRLLGGVEVTKFQPMGNLLRQAC